MLIQLEIKNFAIIEHSIINFDQGFNVITGETGAGKSILLDALSCILGERTSKNLVRKGTEEAELKAVFLKTEEIEKSLKEKNIVIEDDVLIIKRTISKNGRSIVKINGSIHTTQIVKDLCLDLVEICGQRQQQDLLKEDKYLHMLDSMFLEKESKVLRSYQEYFQKWKQTKKELNELLYGEREKEQLIDLYRFQKNEIETARLKTHEDDELEEEKKFLTSFEKISSSLQNTIQKLDGVDMIYEAKSHLMQAEKYNEQIAEYSERLDKAYYELEDIRSEIVDYLDSIEYDEMHLNQIMSRLDEINTLKRKYADTIEGILDYRQMIEQKLDTFDNKEEKIKELEKEIHRLEKSLKEEGEKLHLYRKTIGERLQNQISNELKELCMPFARFEFEIERTKEFQITGFTKVRILFNANKGEELQPLSKVASGGELSRVLLAIKITNQQYENVSTIIFDEIDEGIGGEVGRIVGEKLYQLGHKVQVISISHLPQVAAKGHHHFYIEKSNETDRTVSRVKKLNDEERIQEIARMIYGDEKNETTLKQAKEMLKKENIQ